MGLVDGAHQVDISKALKACANRLIGDEQEPADCTFTEPVKQPHWKDKEGKPFPVGSMLVEFPVWMIKNQPRPGNRVAFCSWNYFTKDSPLLDAGLLGPVQMRLSE